MPSPSSSKQRKLLLPFSVVKCVYLLVAILLFVFVISNLQFLRHRLVTTDGAIDRTEKLYREKLVVPLPIIRGVVTHNNRSNTTKIATSKAGIPEDVVGSCAILLFGLPRAFQQYVLPSLEKNVIRINSKYNCDYYVHFYSIEKEDSGRSGRGGTIHSDDIFLMNNSVNQIYSEEHDDDTNDVIVKFVSDTNASFWKKRSKDIKKYTTTKEKDGKSGNNYLYFPYKELTYEYPKTIINIVKQWHSINSVWTLMERTKQKTYRRIAMIRNDVLFLTPIDIYDIPAVELPGIDYTKQLTNQDSNKNPRQRSLSETTNGKKSVSSRNQRYYDYTDNRISVVPNFAKWPINDRMIAGPYDAVKVWASQRFTKIDEYALSGEAQPGMVMHSETFLNATIFQSIKGMKRPKYNNYELLEDRLICFVRVRADGAIWIEDCDATKSDVNSGGGYPGGMNVYYKQLLNNFLIEIHNGRGIASCRKRRVKDPLRIIYELACNKDQQKVPNNKMKQMKPPEN